MEFPTFQLFNRIGIPRHGVIPLLHFVETKFRTTVLLKEYHTCTLSKWAANERNGGCAMLALTRQKSRIPV